VAFSARAGWRAGAIWMRAPRWRWVEVGFEGVEPAGKALAGPSDDDMAIQGAGAVLDADLHTVGLADLARPHTDDIVKSGRGLEVIDVVDGEAQEHTKRVAFATERAVGPLDDGAESVKCDGLWFRFSGGGDRIGSRSERLAESLVQVGRERVEIPAGPLFALVGLVVVYLGAAYPVIGPDEERDVESE
jgi:hypothetical protein